MHGHAAAFAVGRRDRHGIAGPPWRMSGENRGYVVRPQHRETKKWRDDNADYGESSRAMKAFSIILF